VLLCNLRTHQGGENYENEKKGFETKRNEEASSGKAQQTTLQGERQCEK